LRGIAVALLTRVSVRLSVAKGHPTGTFYRLPEAVAAK